MNLLLQIAYVFVFYWEIWVLAKLSTQLFVLTSEIHGNSRALVGGLEICAYSKGGVRVESR